MYMFCIHYTLVLVYFYMFDMYLYGYIGSCFRVKRVNIPVSKYGQVVDEGSANLTAISTATRAQVELEKGGRSESSCTIIIK